MRPRLISSTLGGTPDPSETQAPLKARFALFGCAVVLALITGALFAKFGTLMLPVIGTAVLVLVILDALSRWRRNSLLRQFRATHGAAGKDLLLIYTDSPHWQPYIEQQWLPRWSHRVVVLNRSRPWDRSELEARLWQSVGGLLEHTPVAIVIPSRGPAQVVRFFSAFRDLKHGKDAQLRAAERRLESALADSEARAA
jgi:hypothetical protein